MIYFRLLATVLTVLLLLSPWQTRAGEAPGEAQYRLAPGDQIRIQVFGEDDLTLEARLGSAGKINYPFLGKIRVTGLTVEELQKKLINGLRDGYLRAPQVNVSIVEHRSFFIEGEVKNPGAYPYQPGLTIRKAVSLAGGYTEFADREHYHLVHDKSPGKSLLISNVNTPVRPGDSITLEKSVFYIDGEVNNPGSYPFHPGLSLREAISLAGGLTERASEGNVVIVPRVGKQRSAKEGMSTRIRLGDSIKIKQSFF